MTARAAASRYAKALFEVALAEGHDVQRIDQQLSAFADLVTGNEQLHRALTNPAIPASRKRAIVEALQARAPQMPAPLAKLLLVLADRDRLVLLPDLVEAYRRRLLDHLKIVRAEVVTAEPLEGESAEALRRGLERATGRDVRLETRVDPAIIGGAVARLGSVVYDGSITRQLERIREALAGATD